LGERKKPKVVSRSFVLRMFSPMASAEVAAAVGAVGAGASSFEQPAKPRLSNAVKRGNVKVDLRVVFIVTEGKGNEDESKVYCTWITAQAFSCLCKIWGLVYRC
jgi:hypothetical protein